LERAGRTGQVTFDGRFQHLIPFEKLIVAEKENYGGLASALRSYFDDLEKCDKHQVMAGEVSVTQLNSP
jgi:hypothetical protein